MFKSKTRKILIVHNLLFKKNIVNRTKLRRSRQKTINYNNSIKKLKNVCRKSITIYNIYELQKFITFYYDKKIK